MKLPLKNRYKKHLNKEGRLIVDVQVNLQDLISLDMQGLNDLMDEIILDTSASLSDISYQVVGSIAPDAGAYIDGIVILRVNATVDSFTY